jgi:hypothetical protein
MDILGTEAAGATDDDSVSIFFPFEDGTGADPELSADVQRD